ncbi:MAG: hypothetical protein ACI9FD_004758, partial [Gammaproteobacteria bacterium]
NQLRLKYFICCGYLLRNIPLGIPAILPLQCRYYLRLFSLIIAKVSVPSLSQGAEQDYVSEDNIV